MFNDAQLTILVNSTNSFADCWQPFFSLFAKYWSNCPHPIVLNVQAKWLEASVVDLFKKHHIEVDYSIRGFYRLNQ